MRKIVLIIWVLACYSFAFSQEISHDTLTFEETEYVVFKLTDAQNHQIRAGLKTQYTLIKLKVHPFVNLTKEQRQAYLKLVDTLQYLNHVSISDSIIVSLKSGISWNLNGEPPVQPKKFYIKVFTEKGRQDQAVNNRLKYLQFCKAWLENREKAYEMIDNYNSFYLISIDGDKKLEMTFELEISEKGRLNITRKEIIFY